MSADWIDWAGEGRTVTDIAVGVGRGVSVLAVDVLELEGGTNSTGDFVTSCVVGVDSVSGTGSSVVGGALGAGISAVLFWAGVSVERVDEADLGSSGDSATETSIGTLSSVVDLVVCVGCWESCCRSCEETGGSSWVEI